MDLINDLETDLALAFLVEQRYRQKIDPVKARALIDQVKQLLESSSLVDLAKASAIERDRTRTCSAH
jgi:hypothetical protein